MIFPNRFGLCGLVLCCLLFVFNVQSAKGRLLLELGNALQIQERLKMEVVDADQKLILNPQLLPNGGTPPSGSNPGHNDLSLAAEDVKLNKGKLLVTNSLPKGPTTPSAPNPKHNLAIDHESQIHGQQVHLESKPKGSTEPSGPSLGHNDQILTGNMISSNMLLQKQASGAIQLEDGESVIEMVQDSSASKTSLSGADSPSIRNALAVDLLPKPPSSPNTKHNKPSDTKRDQMQFSKHTIVTQKPVNDDSTQKLSELVGCQQDIMPM